MEPAPEEKALRASQKTRQHPQTEVKYYESIPCQKGNGLPRPKCRQGMPGSIALARRAAPLLLAPRAGRRAARGPLPTWQTLENPLSLYLSAHLQGERVSISSQTFEYRSERIRLPQAFVQFLQAINREFRHQHPTTVEVRDWMDRLKIELEPGTPVWWHDAPRSGYGSFAPVIAVVVKRSPAKIGIAALKKDGSWVPRWVAPARLSPRQ